MKAARMLKTAIAAASLAAMAACTQMPTEKQSIVDLRPQITFRVDQTDTRLQSARVLVDGLEAGRLMDLLDGKGALRVLPGTHVVQVASDAGLIFEERAYLADGAVRPFIVK
jgi:hypothetical protein